MKADTTLGDLVDAIYNKDTAIDSAMAAVNKLKKSRDKLEQELLRALGKAKIDGCKGRLGMATKRVTPFASIKDREKFERWCIRNRALHLFQNRIMNKAYFDMVEEGLRPPGVSVFEKVSVTIKARKGK